MPAGSVVLLHGCGGSAAATFVEPGWLEALAKAGLHAVPLDLPGHGAYSVSSNPADYADLAGMIALRLPTGVLDAVGFSLGAKLLLALAQRIPARFGRLVLGGIGDNVFAPESVAEAAAQALESGVAADTPPSVRAFLETWVPTRNDAHAVAAVLRRPPNPILTAEGLRAIRAPMLVVNGEIDPVGRQCGQLQAGLPAARFLTLPGVGHFDLPRQRAFIDAATDFLSHTEVYEVPANRPV